MAVGRIRESLRKEKALHTFRGFTRRATMYLRKSRLTQGEYPEGWAEQARPEHEAL